MEPSKSEIAINWIGHGLLRVHLDPRPREVIVPGFLRNAHSIMLEVGLDLPKPIPDLKVDQEAVSGTLSFGSGLHMLCVVPWSAVYALSSPALDLGRVWLSDAPPEVHRELQARKGARANAQVKMARRQARQMKGHLRIVKDKGAA